MLSVLFAMPAHARAPVEREKLELMFANIKKQTQWNMSGNMLWGYFFTHPTRESLDRVTGELARLGYRVVNVYLADKDEPTKPDMWWLHVERVETHSVASLYQRNVELNQFAKRHNLATYDGMDVGPAP